MIADFPVSGLQDWFTAGWNWSYMVIVIIIMSVDHEPTMSQTACNWDWKSSHVSPSLVQFLVHLQSSWPDLEVLTQCKINPMNCNMWSTHDSHLGGLMDHGGCNWHTSESIFLGHIPEKLVICMTQASMPSFQIRRFVNSKCHDWLWLNGCQVCRASWRSMIHTACITGQNAQWHWSCLQECPPKSIGLPSLEYREHYIV